MTPQPSPQDIEKLVKAELKFRAFVACGWGLIVMFAMMGVILGNPKGMVIAIIASVMWVQIRIIREAFDALRLLRALKADVPAPKQDDKDDGGSPPEPPTAA